jgi:hypothetical protein
MGQYSVWQDFEINFDNTHCNRSCTDPAGIPQHIEDEHK